MNLESIAGKKPNSTNTEFKHNKLARNYADAVKIMSTRSNEGKKPSSTGL